MPGVFCLASSVDRLNGYNSCMDASSVPSLPAMLPRPQRFRLAIRAGRIAMQAGALRPPSPSSVLRPPSSVLRPLSSVLCPLSSDSFYFLLFQSPPSLHSRNSHRFIAIRSTGCSSSRHHGPRFLLLLSLSSFPAIRFSFADPGL